MRKTIIAFVVLVAVFLAWSAWPFAGLYDIGRAAQAGDAVKIAARVDFPALRRSLSGQIFQTYARLIGLQLDRGGLMVGAASGLADPFVEKLLSPAALAEFLQGGWPKAILADRPADFAGLDWNALGSAWRLYANADYGLGEFRLNVPANLPAERQFRVQLALTDWTWKLSGLDLPRDLQERLARELMKQQGKTAG